MKREVRYVITPLQACGRRWSITFYLALYLLLDKVHAPLWLFIVCGAVALTFLIITIRDLFVHDERFVDIENILEEQYMKDYDQNRVPKMKKPSPPPSPLASRKTQR